MPFFQRRSTALQSRCANDVRNLSLTFAVAIAVGSGVTAAQPRRGHQEAQAPAAAPAALKTVTLTADGSSQEIQSTATTVQELLQAQKIVLGNDDRCSVAPNAPVTDKMTVTVTRVRVEMVTEKISIPFPVKQRYLSSMPVGKKNVLQPGKNGERVKKFRCIFKDDNLTEKTKIAETATAARPQVEAVGTRGMTLASRGYFAGRRIIEMVATGYGPDGNGRFGAHTASGLRPGFGVVAVDPRFIPLGTRLYVDGYGYAVAGDTGSAIKGNRIDLGWETNAAAAAVGRKKVRVLILD